MDKFKILFAFVPMIWLLVSLGILKIESYKACLAGTVLTAILAVFTFDMSAEYLGQAVLEGAVYAIISICWIIISALLVYNITVKTGALEVIREMLTDISGDRRIQALIIGFAFGGFLEAVAGFGTAVAIPAGILIAMGFQPLKAAVICLVSNTVPVALGVLGVPVISLAETSGLEIGKLAIYICIQLLPFAVLLPVLIIYIVIDSVSKIKEAVLPAILSGLTFAVFQTVTALFSGVSLAAAAGALASLAVLILWCRFGKQRQVYRFEYDKNDEKKENNATIGRALWAWCPYILILVLIIAVQFLPILDQTPFLIEKQLYFGSGGKAITFNWLTNGGSLLFIAAIISGTIQGMNIKMLGITAIETLKQVKISVITIVFVVSLAKIMTYSGMIEQSASLIAGISGSFFPFLSPVIGALGTFITGSDTSSNILFGGLQQQTAAKAGLDQYWIVAGNGAGATAGKMISPQSISIAAASINNAARESEMMGSTVKYCIIYVILMGICVYLGEIFI